ncbi:hypothetical protein Q3G72_034427 [Acer saccharum]|nr:hypothetical protein Q3G72_034427 [Acer saccharum]
MRTRDCEFLYVRKVTDFVLTEETGSISDVVCGKEKYNADAVILAIGISILQELVKNRTEAQLASVRHEALNRLNFASVGAGPIQNFIGSGQTASSHLI